MTVRKSRPMNPQDPLSIEDQAAFEAWTEKFWMFIEDKGDALHIWKAATAHTALRCAEVAERLSGDAGSEIRAEYGLD